jgi:hypothetical protein
VTVHDMTSEDVFEKEVGTLTRWTYIWAYGYIYLDISNGRVR